MENLDEALLSTNNSNFQYMNKRGFEIIEEIQISLLSEYESQLAQDHQAQPIFLSREDLNKHECERTKLKNVRKLTDQILNHQFF
jgi:hypothetical protein